MSLRKINKRTERETWKGFKVLSEFFKGLKGTRIHMRAKAASSAPTTEPQKPLMSHEKRLITPKRLDKKQAVRHDLLLILVIAAIAIAFIVFEFMTMGNRPQEPVIVNNTTTNITNNQTLPTNQTPPVILKPDIALVSFTVSDKTPLTDEPVTISARFENKGNLNISETAARFYVGNTLLREEIIENLTVGASSEINFNWTPVEEHLGQRNLKVILDPEDELDEESEVNNEEIEQVEVSLNIIKDVSSSFTFRSPTGIGGKWYSDKYALPPKGGENFIYFQLYMQSAGVYILDVGIAGFKATKAGLDVYAISIPDASSDGWNGGNCIREHEDGADCVWTGPQITLSLSISKGDLIAMDTSSVKSRASTSDKRIDRIELAGMTVADWPEEELHTFKILGADSPNKFVPSNFYTIDGSKIYIDPMIWNPVTGKARVATTLSFKITTR